MINAHMRSSKRVVAAAEVESHSLFLFTFEPINR